jgi:GGDEF domain-containing protein
MRDADADARDRGAPRAVPDAPIGPYVGGTGLAKAWLLALLERTPLRDVGTIPTAALARDAPDLCAAVVGAVTTDEALARLGAGGELEALARRAGTLAGATEAVDAVAALDVLRDVTSRALRSEGGPCDPVQLAERVAYVCALVAGLAAEGVSAGSPELVVRDARQRPGAWRAALDDALARYDVGGAPVAILSVELDDLDRLVHAHSAEEWTAAVDAASSALTAAAGPGALVTTDAPGRWWIVLDDTEAGAARALAAGIAAAVRDAAVLRGVPLAARVGIATCPSDGTSVDGLAAVADERRFAAQAAGVPCVS